MSKDCYEQMKDFGNVDDQNKCYGKENARRDDVDITCKRCPHFRKNDTNTVNYKMRF